MAGRVRFDKRNVAARLIFDVIWNVLFQPMMRNNEEGFEWR